MALPNAQNIAYRGITSGNAQCIAYRGFICGDIIVESWREIKRFSLYFSQTIKFKLER